MNTLHLPDTSPPTLFDERASKWSSVSSSKHTPHPSVFPPHAHPAEPTSPSGERRERRRDAPAPQTARSTSVRTRRRQDVRGAARKEMTPLLTDDGDGERGVCAESPRSSALKLEVRQGNGECQRRSQCYSFWKNNKGKFILFIYGKEEPGGNRGTNDRRSNNTFYSPRNRCINRFG